MLLLKILKWQSTANRRCLEPTLFGVPPISSYSEAEVGSPSSYSAFFSFSFYGPGGVCTSNKSHAAQSSQYPVCFSLYSINQTVQKSRSGTAWQYAIAVKSSLNNS